MAGALAVLGVSRIVEGLTGLAVGAVVGAAVAWWVSRLEPAAERRRRERIERDLPLVLDLVVAAAHSGRPTSVVLIAVGDAIGEPTADPLRTVAARLDLGVEPHEAWRDVADDPVLAPLGQAFVRASRTGSAISGTLVRAADEARAQQRAAADAAARSVGVRTAAPLGACFLPAFILLGIVPVIASTFRTLGL
ncbi:UNVERIFIED_CONTAM: hypothetical protein LK11_23155 [Mumia flava]